MGSSPPQLADLNVRQRWQARSVFAQWLFLATALLILGGGIGWNLYAERTHIDVRERERLMAQARIVDENLGYQLLATNLALDSIRSDLPELKALAHGKTLLIHRLQAMSDAMPGVRTVAVLDAEGLVTASNRKELIGRNFHQREYFQATRQSRNPALLHVSPPFTTALGIFAVTLAKVVLDDQGKFAGVVAATLDPEYFSTLLDSVRYTPDMWSSLAHGDGKLFLMIPARPGIEGTDLAKPGSFYTRHMESGQQATVMTGSVLATGEERMMAQRIIKPAGIAMDKHLGVAIARDLPSIFAEWRRDAYIRGGLFLALVLTTALGLYASQKRQRTYARLVANQETERLQVMGFLRTKTDQLNEAQRIAGVGSWTLDLQSNQLVWSDEIFRLFEIDPEHFAATYEAFLNVIHPDDRDAVNQAYADSLVHRLPYEITHRLLMADGRIKWVQERCTSDFDATGKPLRSTGTVQDITEYKRLEQEREQYFRFFVLSIDPMCIADPFGCFIQVNPAFTQLTGFEESELVARPFLEFILLEDRQRTADEMKQQVEVRQSLNFENHYVCRDGRIILLSWTAYFDKSDGVTYATARDITKFREAEVALRESESRFRQMFENNASVMLLLDPESGAIVDANAAAARFYGYALEQLRTMRINQINTLSPAEIAARMAQAVHHERDFFVFSHRLASGELRTVEVRSSPIGVTAGTVIFSIVQDVTERELATAELKRSNAELEQFSYAISHDMRQPLRMISSYLQLLEQSVSSQIDSEQRKYFDFAIDGAKRLDQMLVGLLEYSRVGRKGEPPTWVESRALLDEALRFLQPAIAEAQAAIGIHGDWPRILVSRDEILRLVQNLIGNALKFRIAGRRPEISVSSETTTGEWRMSVADNGVGILPDQIERLFRVFQRLQSRTAYEGTGIGLALCRKIAEHHGGRIWARSAGTGQGSTFQVELPVLKD